MEFICDKKELQDSVSLVERIVTTRSTLPIIGNILVDVEKNGIRLSANNLEMALQLSIGAKVSKGGSILLPAKTLAGIVSKLPNTQIGFKLNEKGTIRISYNQSNFNVHTLPSDEFPVLPKIKEGKSFNINAEVFASMIEKTIFSVSSSEDKYILTGVLLEIGKGSDGGNMRMVATDGYRLAKKSAKIKLEKDIKISAIVPAKALQELLRILEQSDGEEVKVTVSNDQIAFKCADVYLVSRLIQGQFPDYKQVIPKKNPIKEKAKTKTLLESAERAAVIAAGSANVVRVEIKNKKLHLSAHTPDVGTIDEVVEADISGGEKLQIAFNVRLITDVLKTVETESVEMEFSEVLGPGVLKEEENEDFLYIVMPIRTQEAG